MASNQDKMLLQNQVREFICQLKLNNAHKIASNHTTYAKQIFSRALEYFDEYEVIDYIIPFGRGHIVNGSKAAADRIQSIYASMKTLLSYLDFKLGDPIAAELLSDTLNQAKEALERKMIICSILLCRLSLEQVLRRLCDLNQITYAPNELASGLNEKLRKPNGIFEKHIWKEVDSRLTFENDVIHGNIQTDEKKCSETISWTERFIDQWLSGR